MSELPSEWKVLPLGEIAEVVGGGTPSRDNPAFWGSDHYWITPSEVVAIDGKTVGRSKEKISNLGLASSGAKLHPPGTILMTSRASIGFAAIAEKEICTNQGFQSLRCGEKLDNWFALHQIRHRRAELQQLAAGSTFLEVSGSNVRSFPFAVPPLPEQKKIAEILSGIDHQIALCHQRIDAVCSAKKALLNRLFITPFEAEASLQELCEEDICYGVLQYNETGEAIIPVIQIRNLEPLDLSKTKMIPASLDQKYSRSRVTAGDLLISVKGSIGKIAVIPKGFTGNISRDIARIRTRRSVVLPHFLKHWFASDPGIDALSRIEVGTTRAELSIGKLRTLRISHPCIEKQSKMCAIINSLDETIIALVRQVEKHNLLKQAISIDLLSGRKRVSV